VGVLSPIISLMAQLRSFNSPFWRAAALLVSFLLLTFALYLNFEISPLRPRVGQIVPYTIVSPVSSQWVDTEKLSRLRSQARSRDEQVEGVTEAQLSKLDSFFAELARLREQGSSFDQAYPQLNSQYGIDRPTLAVLWLMKEAELKEVHQKARDLLSAWMEVGIDREQRRRLMEDLNQQGLGLSPERRIAIYFVRENLVPGTIDEAALTTEATNQLLRGEVVVAEGSRVSQRVMDKLKSIEHALRRQDRLRFAGSFVLLVFWTALLVFYALTYKPKLASRTETILTIGLISFLALLIAIGVMRLPIDYGFYAVSLAPLMLSMVIASLFDSIFALYLAIGVGTLISLMNNFGYGLTVYTLTGALVPPLMLHARTERRKEVLIGMWAAGVNLVLAGVVILISVHTLSLRALLVSAASGFLGVILGLGLAMLIDTFSHVITPEKLKDLLNEDNELLRKLKMSAPGTYLHSLMVAELSHAAALAIGADDLLVRVGALYHDIGKVKHPKYFAENLKRGEVNPHEALSPDSSAKVLRDHVTDGIKMAREAGLPDEVVDFIRTHHGTTLMKFFYEKALEKVGDSPGQVEESQYRYPGPRPFSKETGIVSLADAVEATVRALQISEPDELRRTIHQIIISRLEEGELDDSGLTAGELNQIEQAFFDVLISQAHERVLYPGQKRADEAAGEEAAEGQEDSGEEGGVREEDFYYSDVY